MIWTKKGLIAFEASIAKLFEEGKIRCPLHLSGGNEDELIKIFSKIKTQDYVFSTHRNHYHYLLKGGNPESLVDEILGKPTSINLGQARSMNICDPRINFYTSAIVGGNCAIAVGVGMALKKGNGVREVGGVPAKGRKGKGVTAVGGGLDRKNKTARVWCFVGDGAEDTGHFVEAVRFSLSRNLPVTFIIEDNDMSTDSSKQDRWHNYKPVEASNIIRYSYKRIYPHVGMGKRVTF